VDSARLLVGGDQGLNGRRVLNPVVRMPFAPGDKIGSVRYGRNASFPN
jgi:hypothetical protein